MVLNIFTFHVDSGIMKIGQDYISLAAHLSNKACKKVQEFSRSLPPVMKVTIHPKLKAWPSRWGESEPAESIGLYFLPDNMRCGDLLCILGCFIYFFKVYDMFA